MAKYFFLFSIAIVLFLNGCIHNKPEQYINAKYGLLDLTGWNFDQYEQVPLQGDWEFHWNTLYSQENNPDLAPRDPENSSHYLKLPGVWNGKKQGKETLEGMGYASFRLHILLPDTEKDLAISFPDNFYSVHAIWINGVKREWNGLPNRTPDSTNFTEHDLVDYLILDSKSIDLIVEVANFRGNTRWGGIRTPFHIGKVSRIRMEVAKKYFLAFFIFSSILSIGIYHLSFFWNYQKDKLPIYFTFFCFIVSLYSITTSSAWIVIFPKMDPNGLFVLEFMLELLFTPACYMYLNYLFPLDFSKSLKIFLMGITSSIIALILILPIEVISYYYKYSLYIPIIFGTYILLMMMKAYILKRKFSGIILFSVAILFLFMINDVMAGLYNAYFISNYSFPIGLLIFISIHSHMISVRQSEAFRRAEELVHLQNKYSQQIKSQAEERSRIARDIHDSIGSEITALITYVNSEEKHSDDSIANMKKQLSGVLINIRDIVYLLGQNKKEKDILEGEISKYIERLELSGKYKIKKDIQMVSSSLGIERSLNTQRIFLEIMTNIIRHSKADHIGIRLKRFGSDVVLIVMNNGVPFTWTGEDEDSGNFGLDGLVLRAKRMKAKIRYFNFQGLNYSVLKVPV